MRRKQKRLLQIALLLLLAFLLLPNIGLWSASLERMFDSSADAAALSHAQRMNTVQNAGVRRKDWHDHALMKSEAARSGVGEQGRPYPLTDSDRVDQAYRENGFNIFVSNRISLNRSLPDIRHPKASEGSSGGVHGAAAEGSNPAHEEARGSDPDQTAGCRGCEGSGHHVPGLTLRGQRQLAAAVTGSHRGEPEDDRVSDDRCDRPR
uniref:Uncharacterized protein n=1 Tax=Cyprinus carpio carpio TaxID=630221 RepID=A0A9J8BD92_CYPCA